MRVEKYHKAFNELLSRCNAFVFEDKTYYGDRLLRLLEDVEEEYNRIRIGCYSQLDNNKKIIDILNNSFDIGKVGGFDFLVDKQADSIREINELVYYEMIKKLIPFYLKMGDLLIQQDECEKGLDTWEEVLKIDPGNSYIHSRIDYYRNKICMKEARVEQNILNLLEKYKLNYIKSFGGDILKLPRSIMYSSYHDIVLVSDAQKNNVCKFTNSGVYEGVLLSGLNEPVGICEDSDHDFLICDWGNARIIKADKTGKHRSELKISDISGYSDTIIYPRFVSVQGDRIVIIITDESCLCRKIIAYDGNTSELIDTKNALLVHDLKAAGGKVFTTCSVSGKIFCIENNSNELNQIACSNWAPIYSIAVHDDSIFLIANYGKSIIKFGMDGEMVFIVREIEFLVDRPVQFHMTVSMQKKKSKHLIARDPEGNLYLFEV